MERKRAALIKEVDGVTFLQAVCGGMHSVAVTQEGEVNCLFCVYLLYHLLFSFYIKKYFLLCTYSMYRDKKHFRSRQTFSGTTFEHNF